MKVFHFSCIFSSCHRDDIAKADLSMSTMEETCRSLVDTKSCEYPTMMRTDVMIKKLSCAQIDCTPDFGGVPPDVNCLTSEGKNQRMPATSPGPLEKCKIDAIKTWIMNGLTGCPGIDAPVDGPLDGRSDGQ